MTQQEKQLLLKDLCARLPYGVMVHFEGWNPEKLSEVNLNEDVYNGMGGLPLPYLCPMSSMIEEERREYDKLIAKCVYDPEAYFFENYNRLYDWLLSHHFDYRGLIEKGLALEALPGMYETE